MDTNQPQQNRPEQQGSGFTNLSQYIGANQNNQLGQTVAGGVQQAGQAATGAINQAGQNFQQGVNTEQSRLSGLGQDVSNSLSNLGNIQQSDINNTQSALSGQGQGPTGLSNTGDIQQKAQSAQQQGQATGSEMGRFGLLQNYVGKGQQYGLGQQTLDSAILGQTGQQQLGQARAATSGLGAKANQAIASANAQGQQLQNQAQQLASNTKNQLGQAVTSYDQSMQQRVAADQAAQQSLIQQLSGQGTNAPINIDPAAIANLSTASGGVLNAGTSLYNVDLSPYLQGNNLNLNAQGVQGTSDFTKAQALNQLAGNGLNGMTQGNILQQYISNPTAVGAYDPNNSLSVTSQSGLNDALNAAASGYNSNLKQIQDQQYNLLNNGAGGLAGNPYEHLTSLDAFGNAIDNLSHGGEGATPEKLTQAQDALAAWSSQKNALDQRQAALSGQFNTLRTLGNAPTTTPAVSSNPILGNDGQPLTS